MINKLYNSLKEYSFGIVIFLILILFFDVFVVMPIGENIKRREGQIITANSLISNSNSKLNSSLKTKNKMKENSISIIETISSFGKDEAETNFIHSINNFLIKSKLTFEKIQFKREKKDNINSYICSADLDYYSSLKNLTDFLKRVRKSEYFITIDLCNIKFLEDDKIKGDIKLSFYLNKLWKKL